MTQPYSNDLRERVVEAHLAGEPIRQVAARFGVSVSSVPKWVARFRATGSVAPGKIGGHRPWLLEPHRELVHRLVAETPHLTIDRLRDLLAAAGIAVSRDHHLALPQARGAELQKKLCSPLSRRAPQSPASGRAGKHSSATSTPTAWSSWTRPGSRPTWRRSGAGHSEASA